MRSWVVAVLLQGAPGDAFEALKQQVDARIAAAQQKGRWLDAVEVAEASRAALELARTQRGQPGELDALLFAADLAGSVEAPATIALWETAIEPLATRFADDERLAAPLLYMQAPPWLAAKADALLVRIDAATHSQPLKAAYRWRILDRERQLDWSAPLDEAVVVALIDRLDAFAKEFGALQSQLGAHWDEPARAAQFALRHLRIGCVAPPLAGRDRTGTPLALADFRGKVVLVEFFAFWCEEWLSALPAARAQAARLAERPFARLGVNCDPPGAALDALFTARPMAWPSLLDGDPSEGALFRQWDVAGLPTLYLIDAQGVIRGKWLGLPGPTEPREPTQPDGTAALATDHAIDRAIDLLLAESSPVSPRPGTGDQR
ncbi:MAG: TlpA family protein disulfide reductase [Myxococcales bacterium]|nr:TlpA family protein disulfide reductase [Myxococcales bacterium]